MRTTGPRGPLSEVEAALRAAGCVPSLHCSCYQPDLEGTFYVRERDDGKGLVYDVCHITCPRHNGLHAVVMYVKGKPP